MNDWIDWDARAVGFNGNGNTMTFHQAQERELLSILKSECEQLKRDRIELYTKFKELVAERDRYWEELRELKCDRAMLIDALRDLYEHCPHAWSACREKAAAALKTVEGKK
jgi:uncharacterized coiled-coil DUF342 family protein